MFTLLWQYNTIRSVGDTVCLVSLANTERVTYLPAIHHLKFYDKNKTIYARWSEIACGVFLVEHYETDRTAGTGRRGVVIKWGEDNLTADLKEFDAYKYRLVITSDILDIEGLNRFYWNLKDSDLLEQIINEFDPIEFCKDYFNSLNA